MDRENIVEVLKLVGAKHILPYGGNVQCSCFLAAHRKGHKNAIDRKPSMGVSIDPKGASLVHCFTCEYGGTLEESVIYLHQHSDEDYTELVARVAQIEEVDPEFLAHSIPDYDEPPEAYVRKPVAERLVESWRGIGHQYVLRRGITIPTLKAWDGGFDSQQKRVTFPVRDRDGTLVGAVGRAVGQLQKPKYLNYFEFDKGHYLFGEHLIKEGTALVVTEGLLDAVVVWQALNEAGRLNDYSVVSCLGAKVTRYQRQKLVKDADVVTLFLDNDPAGWEGQATLARFLQRQVVLKAVRYPDVVGGDPADLLERGVDIVNLIDSADLLVV